MGCYPIFACWDWTKLPGDLKSLTGDIVCISLVTDPFGNHTPKLLQKCFPDLMIPFKQHFVNDLEKGIDVVSKSHRRNIRKAAANLDVEVCNDPIQYLDDWVSLYDVLIERHGISGISAFSRKSFELQLRVPGITAFQAVSDNKTVGLLLWYCHGDVAYYHLGSYNARGYELRASFALFMKAIEYYREQGVRWLNLGAGAGLDAATDDGLTRFKRGWATETRTAYLCGRIFDRKLYDELVQRRKISKTSYFPAYRQGEFGG